jgi:hypothetical protein
MSTLDFFLTFGLGPLALFITGMAAFVLARRSQRRFFAEHPEYPNPFERHTPAE